MTRPGHRKPGRGPRLPDLRFAGLRLTGLRLPDLRLTGRRRVTAIAGGAAVAAGIAAAVVVGSPLGGSSTPAQPTAVTRSIPPDQSYVAPPGHPSARPPGGLAPARPGHRPSHPHGLSPSPAPSLTLPPPSTATLTVEVATSGTFGPVLVDANGMTLYRDTAVASGTVTAHAYRPLTPRPGLRQPPLLPGHLGTVTRPDGTTQVTYNGWPLYQYTGDHAPGDTNGTGGSWQLIKATP
jgi:predicted lipoprotein with Yx(FWY)xxD motif